MPVTLPLISDANCLMVRESALAYSAFKSFNNFNLASGVVCLLTRSEPLLTSFLASSIDLVIAASASVASFGAAGVAGAPGPAGPSIGLVTSSNSATVPAATFAGFPPLPVSGTVTIQTNCPASHLAIGVVCRKTSLLGTVSISTPEYRLGGQSVACTFTNSALFGAPATAEVLIQCLPF